MKAKAKKLQQAPQESSEESSSDSSEESEQESEEPATATTAPAKKGKKPSPDVSATATTAPAKKGKKDSPEVSATATTAPAKKGKTNTPTVPLEADVKQKLRDEMTDLRKVHEGHLEEWGKALRKKREAGNAIFALYENLLDETALLKWNKIVEKQIGVTPWTDLNGISHNDKARQKTVKSFKDCVKFHLLQVFPNDAAEKQKYYINNHLRKPAKVTIRNFAERVETLNSYIANLPGLIDSPKALPCTTKIKPYEEAELAQALLRMCPTKWQDQFNLTQGIIPQSLRNTIETLETIEQFQESSKPPGKPNGDGKKGSDLKKRKGKFKDERVPKKNRTGKSCELCKKHGGAHMTHNTADCKRYSKDGSEKKGFKKKPYKQSEPTGGQSYATKEDVAEIKQMLKDKKAKKRMIEDDDSD